MSMRDTSKLFGVPVAAAVRRQQRHSNSLPIEFTTEKECEFLEKCG